MRPPEGIANLAREMIERHADDERIPLMLFLGKDCADAAKVPDITKIARWVFQDPSLPTAKYVEERDRRYNKQLLEAFYEFWADLSRRERYEVLQAQYARVPVPLFYQDLVRLIKAGYVSHILTTNIDTLLEQALSGAGLWPDKDYEVISLGSRELPLPAPPDAPKPGITITKLHGDLGKREAAITPQEITDFLKQHRRFVKGELSGDMVMVGYEFESEPVTKWLAWTSGTLWWVSEEPPPGQQIESIEESRQIVHVHGESARPEVFFGQLLYLLEQAGRASVSAKAKAPLYRGGEDEPRPIEEYSDAEYLREQVRRSQQILYGLQQRIIPGEGDEYLGAQIAYQRHTIAKLEDQLRGLVESRERLLELATQVNDAVQQARQVDPRTKNFVDNQLGTITDEFSRDEPNQDIVSASTSTMVVLAERVGPEVVDSDVVRELASFAYRSVG